LMELLPAPGACRLGKGGLGPDSVRGRRSGAGRVLGTNFFIARGRGAVPGRPLQLPPGHRLKERGQGARRGALASLADLGSRLFPVRRVPEHSLLRGFQGRGGGDGSKRDMPFENVFHHEFLRSRVAGRGTSSVDQAREGPSCRRSARKDPVKANDPGVVVTAGGPNQNDSRRLSLRSGLPPPTARRGAPQSRRIPRPSSGGRLPVSPPPRGPFEGPGAPSRLARPLLITSSMRQRLVFQVFPALATIGTILCWGDPSTRLLDVSFLSSFVILYFGVASAMRLFHGRTLRPAFSRA